MSKLRSWMDLPVFANDDLQIEIAAVVVGKTRVRKRMPARAPPREFHKLRARVRRHRRWIDAHGAPGGAPDREPSRYALRVGVRPCWKSCPSATPGRLNRKSRRKMARWLMVARCQCTKRIRWIGAVYSAKKGQAAC